MKPRKFDVYVGSENCQPYASLAVRFGKFGNSQMSFRCYENDLQSLVNLASAAIRKLQVMTERAQQLNAINLST